MLSKIAQMKSKVCSLRRIAHTINRFLINIAYMLHDMCIWIWAWNTRISAHYAILFVQPNNQTIHAPHVHERQCKQPNENWNSGFKNKGKHFSIDCQLFGFKFKLKITAEFLMRTFPLDWNSYFRSSWAMTQSSWMKIFNFQNV